MVCLQRIQHLGQGVGHLFHQPGLLGRQIVEVLVHGRAGIGSVLDAVQAGHQQGGEGKVWIAAGIGGPELDALGPRTLGVYRNPADGRPVPLGVGQVDRCLKAGHQPPVGVGGGRGQRQQG